jgi:hypothetical protein
MVHVLNYKDIMSREKAPEDGPEPFWDPFSSSGKIVIRK